MDEMDKNFDKKHSKGANVYMQKINVIQGSHDLYI